jgi:hypothetical protein
MQVETTINPEEEGLDKSPYKALLAAHLRHHGVHVTNHLVVRGGRHGAVIKKHLDPKKSGCPCDGCVHPFSVVRTSFQGRHSIHGVKQSGPGLALSLAGV